jgi:hypothetical protein
MHALLFALIGLPVCLLHQYQATLRMSTVRVVLVMTQVRRMSSALANPDSRDDPPGVTDWPEGSIQRAVVSSTLSYQGYMALENSQEEGQNFSDMMVNGRNLFRKSADRFMWAYLRNEGYRFSKELDKSLAAAFAVDPGNQVHHGLRSLRDQEASNACKLPLNFIVTCRTDPLTHPLCRANSMVLGRIAPVRETPKPPSRGRCLK